MRGEHHLELFARARIAAGLHPFAGDEGAGVASRDVVAAPTEGEITVQLVQQMIEMRLGVQFISVVESPTDEFSESNMLTRFVAHALQHRTDQRANRTPRRCRLEALHGAPTLVSGACWHVLGAQGYHLSKCNCVSASTQLW